MHAVVEAVDPFDLPDWLGTAEVTWTAAVRRPRGPPDPGHAGMPTEGELPCDLMAADVAYPEPLLADPWRRQAHQAWEHGQVQLLSYDGRLTLAVPGTAYSADGALETIGRLAKAVGAESARFTVRLRP